MSEHLDKLKRRLRIADVFASADAPASPASGDVWVWLGGDSLAPIALTDLFTVHPRAVYQYNGSEWVLLESYVYTGGAWVEVTMLIYTYGTEFLAVMNYEVKSGDVTWTRRSDDIQFYSEYQYSGDRYGVMWTDRVVDLTLVSQIKLITSAGYTGQLGVNTGRSSSFLAATGFSSGNNQTVTLDVSALSGMYYVGVRFNRADGTVYSYIHEVELVR
ncbi:MAG: hypothetical protein ABIG45_01345 [Bacillota bacterium]